MCIGVYEKWIVTNNSRIMVLTVAHRSYVIEYLIVLLVIPKKDMKQNVC